MEESTGSPDPAPGAPAEPAPPPEATAPAAAEAPGPPDPAAPVAAPPGVTAARSGLWVLALLLVGAALFFVGNAHQHYPVQKWLFWRYAGYWLSSLACGVSFLALGHVTVTRTLGRTLRPLEHLSVAFVLGLFEFELLMFFAGLAQLFRWPLFFGLPALCLAIGGRSLWRTLRGWGLHLRPMFARARRLRAIDLVMMGFGAVGFLMLYFLVISPENVQFDARWKHLRIAEEFFVHGGFRVFPEGWTFSSRPHMTSYLYLWAFLAPSARPFDQVLGAAHLEFMVFLFTTCIGIPALVRRLLPDADTRVVWAARFLFPGVLLYDSSLAVGADHFGAAYCLPIFFLTLEALPALEPRRCGLLALSLAGAALVKDTNAYMLVPPAIVSVALRTAQLAVGWPRFGLPATRERWQWLRGPAVAVIGCLVFTAPLWLKNWLAYGNPIYPVAHHLFSPRPWTADAAEVFKHGYETTFWSPSRDLWGLGRTFSALIDWSFVPNDWKKFHGNAPVIGSLFTLLLLSLPFVAFRPGPRTRRLWLLILWIHFALFFWYWVHHQDRYIQSLMPWIVAVTAVLLILVWRLGHRPSRAALVLLVGVQLVWGGDVFFFPTHAMVRTPIKKTVDLLSAGSQKNYDGRFSIGQDTFVKLGEAVPKGARVLMHERQNYFGMRAESVTDHTKWQYGISYGLLESPHAVYIKLRAMGATHLVWRPASTAYDTIAGDLMFHDFAHRFSIDRRTIGDSTLAAMPAQPPTETTRQFFDGVAVLGCEKEYKTGLYRVADFRVPMWGPRVKEFPPPRQAAMGPAHAVQLVIDGANYVLVDPACAARYPGWQHDFTSIFTRRTPNKNIGYEGFIRNVPLRRAPQGLATPPGQGAAP